VAPSPPPAPPPPCSPHGSKCWLYFPEDDCPFYRTTVFSNYAQSNCPAAAAALPTLCKGDGSAADSAEPQPGPYWSLMFEISESQYKPVDQQSVAIGGQQWWAAPAGQPAQS
jgi:hypothetical protein